MEAINDGFKTAFEKSCAPVTLEIATVGKGGWQRFKRRKTCDQFYGFTHNAGILNRECQFIDMQDEFGTKRTDTAFTQCLRGIATPSILSCAPTSRRLTPSIILRTND